jgi:uncharacterized protein (TIGR02646 family)
MSWRKNQIISHRYDQYPGNKTKIAAKKKTWDSKTNEIKALKSTIKKHYSIVQNDTCAYCRTPVRFDGYGEAIEHIVVKSEKFRWMFHPYNLCISCYGCNTKKGIENTLINVPTSYANGYNDIPLNSNSYRIIHPHFDTYSKYIQETKLLCIPKTTSIKGPETIRICKLNRLDLIYTRARQKSYSKRTLQKILVRVVGDTSFRKEERESAQKMVDTIIDRYNYIKQLP